MEGLATQCRKLCIGVGLVIGVVLTVFAQYWFFRPQDFKELEGRVFECVTQLHRVRAYNEDDLRECISEEFGSYIEGYAEGY